MESLRWENREVNNGFFVKDVDLNGQVQNYYKVMVEEDGL